MRKEIDDSLASPVPFLSASGFKHKSQKADKHTKSQRGPSLDDDNSKGKNRSEKSKNRDSAEKSQLKKRHGADIQMKAPKKLRA